jgi:hypothetical protein
LKGKQTKDVVKGIIIKQKLSFVKQEGHDGPEVAHPYLGPTERGQFKPQDFYLNRLGRHPLEDISC